MTDRLFTPAEANALLPALRPLIAAMRASTARLAGALEAIGQRDARAERTGGTIPTDAEVRAATAADTARADLQAALEGLTAQGVVIKDPLRGLIDFPSVRDGEVVELCYLDGEPEVGHWHRVGEGFAGRTPL